MQNGCNGEIMMLMMNSHMVNPVAFDTFHIIGSRLWMLWGNTLKVYGYEQIWYFLKLLVHVVISDK
jgi:hypothetical protein